MGRRTQALVLAAICVVGFLRGGWWVAVTEVWSPIDEIAHLDYVASMATRGRPPEVGVDKVRGELLELAKESATSPWRSSPLTSNNQDPKWGAFAESYEGVQGPLYYGVLAPVWKLVNGYGALTTLYILRIITLLLALAAVPLVWLLARELFPERVEVAAGSSLLLVLLGGFNGNVASITNDALVMPLATATLWLVARTWRRGFELRSAIAVGVLVGLAVITKTTALALIPMVALGALGPLWTRGTVARRYIAWGAQAGAFAAAVVVPWLAFNRVMYGAFSAAEAVDKITGPLQPPIPLSPSGFVSHLRGAGTGFWSAQLTFGEVGHTAIFWTLAGVAAIALGLVLAWRNAEIRDALAIGWMAAAVPLGFLTMVVIIAGVFGGSSSVVGRHLYPGLPALCVAIVGAVVTAWGRNIALAALGAVVAIGLTFEITDTRRYVRGAYTRGVIAGLTPILGQDRGDDAVPGPLSVRLEANCKIGGVGLEFAETSPDQVMVRIGDRPAVPARASFTRVDPGRGAFAFYAIPAVSHGVNVDLPENVSIAAGLPSTDAERLEPVGYAFCETKHPARERFAHLFDAQHPNWSLGFTTAWPVAWAALAWLGAIAAAAYAFLRRN